MTPSLQEKIDVIRQRAIAANPEIMELKFGCKIRVKPEYRSEMEDLSFGYVAGVDFAVMVRSAVSLNHSDMSLDLVRAYPKKFEIIGRPIHLSDILLAIDRKYNGDQFATIASNGWFHFGRNRGVWNLRKDDLNEQGEPTISFLYDVLK